MTAPDDRFTEDDFDARIAGGLRALTQPAAERVRLPSFVDGPPQAGRWWPAVRVGAAAVVSLVVAMGSIFVVSGLVGRPGSGAQEPAPWGPLAVVPPSNLVMEALAVGTLDIGDECVILEEADNDVLLLVWPADRVTWNAQERTIIILENLDGDTVTLRDGAPVAIGGGGDSVDEGGVSGEAWVKQVEWVAPPAPSCPLEARWTVGRVQRPAASPSPTTAPSSSPEETAWLPPWAGPATPLEVVTRSVLPFCGVEEGGFAGIPDPEVRDCFLAALQDGSGAEFARMRSTTEGDPIATITRALPGGGLEILVDSTQDAFGAPVWARTICRGFVEDDEFGFVQDGCDDGVVIR